MTCAHIMSKFKIQKMARAAWRHALDSGEMMNQILPHAFFHGIQEIANSQIDKLLLQEIKQETNYQKWHLCQQHYRLYLVSSRWKQPRLAYSTQEGCRSNSRHNSRCNSRYSSSCTSTILRRFMGHFLVHLIRRTGQQIRSIIHPLHSLVHVLHTSSRRHLTVLL